MKWYKKSTLLKEKDKMILNLKNGDDISCTDAHSDSKSKCGANDEEITKLL